MTPTRKTKEWRKLADQYDTSDEFGYAKQFGQTLRDASDLIEEYENIIRNMTAAHRNQVAQIKELESELETSERVETLEDIRAAASSVLSEDGVREYLSAYVMGCELITLVERASDNAPDKY